MSRAETLSDQIALLLGVDSIRWKQEAKLWFQGVKVPSTLSLLGVKRPGCGIV